MCAAWAGETRDSGAASRSPERTATQPAGASAQESVANASY
jgi:hypothetical protein